MTELIKYEAARRALNEAVMFDEVMAIMNVAEQAALYAKQANDNDLIEKATEIRVRAQRRAGEMLRQASDQRMRADQSDAGRKGAAKRWNSESSAATSHQPTLAEIGITKDQSSHFQQLAAMPDEHFETAVATAKATAGEVTTAFMLREAAKTRPAHPKKGPKAEAVREELKAAKDRGTSMLCSYARLLLNAISASESFTEEERRLLAQVESAISTTRSVCA